MPNGLPGPLGANPFAAAQPPKEPIVSAGEEAITKLLQMASSSPQLLLGLSMAGAAREISQLTGLSRRRGGGTAGSPSGAQPSAATLLGGSMGDLDRLVALQSMMGGGAPPGGPPLGGAPAPLGGTPVGPPLGGAPPLPSGLPGAGGNPLAALLAGAGGGLPPQFAGLV